MPNETAITMSTDLAKRRPRRPQAFLSAHPDLYTSDGGKVRLAIHDGDLLTGSLTAPGFATSVHPDWSTLQKLARSTTKNLQEHEA